MMRNLVIWMLVAPLLLNGLWMVCNVGPSAAAKSGPDSSGQSEQAADCARICAAKHRLNNGEMCFILPGDARTSITVIDFGAAISPYDVFHLERTATTEQFVADMHSSYLNPSLSYTTPPPRV